MGSLRPEMITLHRVDNGEVIYVRGDSVTMIEPSLEEKKSTYVYIGSKDRVRYVKETPEQVKCMVERSV